MNGRRHRTDLLAGCVFAMLTGHGLKHHIFQTIDIRLVHASFKGVITIDAKPVHLAAANDLVLAHDGNVVFRLTGDNTRAATDAGAEIDRHSPGILCVLALFRGMEGVIFAEQGKPVDDMSSILVIGELWIFPILNNRGLADQGGKPFLNALAAH